ncbi:hypothetical protein ACVIHI_007972 [Bradyrhizobium sp. USDA 4524]|uniref:hypothetical protein n=1 Tax=unclassified Bradyrhizobium TaxID=2631580 RepID=UPI00209E890A|nr:MULTISPECIES: hypothetical protein [unclassified Bradyrhizobium]MCP1839114.1 hypothetical protein [Bradyrhizobium sp. USDA 4538]MCP1899679.1 hypothetical protein [Bradyrhizobium sp. USDA 4537]MCP1986211.1 hypothetical protein [Bradyrhizobium sp. USDA 4539]
MRAGTATDSRLRERYRELTEPHRGPPGMPAQIARGHDGAAPDEVSHIDPWMEVSFNALTRASETGEPFALISCFMNGQPAAVIAATHRQGSRTQVMPLFMAVQPWMNFGSEPVDTIPEKDGD